MTRYEIFYRPEIHDDLDAIPKNVVRRIKKAIEERLETLPRDYGERLSRSLCNLWKIRCGDYRIVYEIHEGSRSITLWAILHRREIYEEVFKRWLRR